MSTSEDHQQQLQDIQVKKWADKAVRKVHPVPGERRSELRKLVDPSAGWGISELKNNRRRLFAQNLGTQNDRHTKKLVNAFFPKLSPHILRAMEDCPRRPFQQGYVRFPFRAPNHQQASMESRSAFFFEMCQLLGQYDQGIEWVAAWAPHIAIYAHQWQAGLGWLLASAIREGGDEGQRVRQILIDSINGEHEIGFMGGHAIVALLNTDYPEDWEVIAKLLLAAQRQEGLRQSILESIDEANPKAFRYILGVIREHNLERFSATVRAFDTWLGMQWAGGSVRVIQESIDTICELLDDEEKRKAAIDGSDPEQVYIGLWVMAFLDAPKAAAAAGRLLTHDEPGHRYIAAITLDRIALFPESLQLIGERIISGQEEDPRVQMALCGFIARVDFVECEPGLFAALGKLYNAFPASKRKPEPLVWPWSIAQADRRQITEALKAVAKATPDEMLPYLSGLDSYDVARIVEEIAGIGKCWDGINYRKRKRKKLNADQRSAILPLTCDRRAHVQTVAFAAMGDLPVEPDEVALYMKNLHRTASELRMGIMGRLAKLKETEQLKIIEELLGDSKIKKKQAGLELADGLQGGKYRKQIQSLIRSHIESITDPGMLDQANRILADDAQKEEIDQYLGLVPPKSRTKPIKAKSNSAKFKTSGAKKCIQGLAELFLEHAETEIQIDEGEFGSGGSQAVLLGNAGYRFPRPKLDQAFDQQDLERLPLLEVWQEWLVSRPSETRDPDGLELIRAIGWATQSYSFRRILPSPFRKKTAWGLYDGFVIVLKWVALMSNPPAPGPMLADYLEHALAKADPAQSQSDPGEEPKGGGEPTSFKHRQDMIMPIRRLNSSWIDHESLVRQSLIRIAAIEQGIRAVHDLRVEDMCALFADGLINDRDFVWYLIHNRGKVERSRFDDGRNFGPISEVSSLKGHPAVNKHPALVDAVAQMRERIIEVELKRGEQPGPASKLAAELRYAGGARNFFAFLKVIGRDKLDRQNQWGDLSRSYSLSRLISQTNPTPEDSQELFNELNHEYAIKPKRLMEVGMYAPQWAGHLERALGMDGYEEAVWWIHAHTKQNDYWRGKEFRAIWASQINERTELESEDLEAGAVDVAWFRKVIDELGLEGWEQLQGPAKYASNSGGHKRGQLFANAMLDRLDRDELMEKIKVKRHQDSVRAIGLIPLPKAKGDHKRELLARYATLQEFKRESRKFGSQRQASEGLAVDIGMKNLARTAGYRDPVRLQWAMEWEAVADLAEGPVAVTEAETTVTLSINESGTPEIKVLKKGKPLKAIPAKLRKHPEISELKSRVTDLRRQGSRMRRSLEESMSRAEAFEPSEIVSFCKHPILRPIVERLVFVGDGDLIGYPDQGGRVLRDHAQKLEPIGKNDTLRLVHPIDLLSKGDWRAWQVECFSAERIQPFKQIFREVYPRTASENAKTDLSRRYAGHQVQPRKAMSLLKQRQWIHTPEGGVRRVYHEQGLVAELWFQEHFYTPAEVEGLTLEGVAFTQRKKPDERLQISQIPDRIFSEAMRDLDLVVSVAHAGGVDPEASASTVEMRATLLRETCQVLNLSNVRIDGQHAIIDGQLASYSVHLGSANAAVLPGRALFIVAVHSQHRGRVFLPFADDDPKTAEVIAKTLLLAQDDQIKDPGILEQIH